MGDSDNVFTVAMMGLRDPNTDDISANLFIGTLQTASGRSGKTRLFELRQQADGSVPGLTKFTEDVTASEIKNEGTDELYGNFAKRWTSPGRASLWLASEFFVINNAGKVKNLSSFTDGSVNFESLFKDTAAELGIFAKTNNASNAPSSVDATDFAGGNSASKNIDVVIIPDIFVSVIKSLASSLSSISKSVDSSFSSVSNAE